MPTEHRSRSRFPSCTVAVLLALVTLAGCGDGGPARFEVSGKVTYDGKPVPAGFIVFIPEDAKGNSGPATTAGIEDGQFRTLPGKGTIGGPHIAAVYGFDGKHSVAAKDPGGTATIDPMRHPLFKTTTIKVNLPKEKTGQDIMVPKQ
jgi:hypothetical protein